MKPVIYLAGAINGKTDEECKGWRDATKIRLADLYQFLDPMDRDYRGVEAESVEAIVHGDRNDIESSQLVLVNASAPSWGTAMELVYAMIAGVPVVAFGAGERPSPWLVFHSQSRHSSVELAWCQLIADHRRYWDLVNV